MSLHPSKRDAIPPSISRDPNLSLTFHLKFREHAAKLRRKQRLRQHQRKQPAPLRPSLSSRGIQPSQQQHRKQKGQQQNPKTVGGGSSSSSTPTRPSAHKCSAGSITRVGDEGFNGFKVLVGLGFLLKT